MDVSGNDLELTKVLHIQYLPRNSKYMAKQRGDLSGKEKISRDETTKTVAIASCLMEGFMGYTNPSINSWG